MFAQSMKLRGNVKLELDNTMTFHGKLYDNTPFHITVGKYDVTLNEEFKPSKQTVEAWLGVMKESQQGDRCYLTLPHPSIQFGHQITVSEYDLMPVGVSLEDFKAKPGKKVPLDPDATPEEIEAKVMNTVKKKVEPGKKIKKAAKKSTKKAIAKSS